MPANQFLDYEASGVAGLLRTRSLAVPFYQRSYSWRPNSDTGSDADDKLQVVEFWDDLTASFGARARYFMGTVVMSRDGADGRESVIDGQQRLATTSILIAAIRDKFRERGEPAFAGSTHQDYLARFDRIAGEDLPKLILNTDDRDFYSRRIVGRDLDVEPAGVSQRLMLDAYKYLAQRVDEFSAQAGTSWRDKLTELVAWLDQDLQVVAITVPTEADAFQIFETLNDRGADLTVADLLKNYLFSKAVVRLDEVRDNWVRTLDNLDIGRVGNQRFTTFARHLVGSMYGRTRERDVYARLKDIVRNPATAVSFSQQLRDSSRVYYALLASDSDFWADFTSNTADAADVLVQLNLERNRPLMLAALTKFDSVEIQRFVPTMVSWAIRGLVAGSLAGGVAEAAFFDAAVEVHNRRIHTTEEVLSLPGIDALIPNDDQFRDLFAVWRTARGPLARYLLRTLELQLRGEPEPELVVNDDVERVNLEHILPKGARPADWPRFTDDDRRAYTDRIGNMCLLQKGPNGRIGNKKWTIKRPILAGSRLELTKQASAAAEWTTASIDERQRVLANLAVQAWPRHPR